MGGRNVLSSAPQEDLGGMNPAAIHRQAAEMVLKEKEMDLQKSAMELEKTKALTALAQEQTKSEAQRRGVAIEQEPFNRQTAIDTEYKRRVTQGQEDWAAGETRLAATDKWRKDQQRDDYKRSMAGLFQGNGEAIKNYINKYGDPNTNVDKIEFAPDGTGGLIVTPTPGKDGKPTKPMFFSDPQKFHDAFMFFMHPDSSAMIQQGGKGGEGETKLSPADAGKIANDAKKNAMEGMGLMPGVKASAEQEKQLDAIGAKAVADATAQSQAASGVRRGGPAIQAPKAVPGTGTEGAGQGTATDIVRTGVDKKTGRPVQQLADGRVVFADVRSPIAGKTKQPEGKTKETPGKTNQPKESTESKMSSFREVYDQMSPEQQAQAMKAEKGGYQLTVKDGRMFADINGTKVAINGEGGGAKEKNKEEKNNPDDTEYGDISTKGY